MMSMSCASGADLQRACPRVARHGILRGVGIPIRVRVKIIRQRQNVGTFYGACFRGEGLVRIGTTHSHAGKGLAKGSRPGGGLGEKAACRILAFSCG
jgi:hypothetical protein